MIGVRGWEAHFHFISAQQFIKLQAGCTVDRGDYQYTEKESWFSSGALCLSH